jgi:tetrahydrodipicolinate N-succinyltransferase
MGAKSSVGVVVGGTGVTVKVGMGVSVGAMVTAGTQAASRTARITSNNFFIFHSFA